VPNELVQRNPFITQGNNSQLPPAGTAGFQPGQLFQHQVTGALFRNIGTALKSIHTDFWSNRLHLEERFLLKPGIATDYTWPGTYDAAASLAIAALNPNWIIAGTNAVGTCAAFAVGGGITLTTTTASGDQVLLGTRATYSDWNTARFRPDESPSFECVLTTGASIAAVKIIAGLKKTNTTTDTTDTDQAYFRFDTADTISAYWQCNTSTNNTDASPINSAVALAASTSYHLLIQVLPGTRVPLFFINGALVGTGAALQTGDINLKPFVGIHTTAAAAKSVAVRGIRCGKTYAD